MSIILPYMVRAGAQQHITEPYVSVPPALTIIDERGAVWTLGFKAGEAPTGEFAFNVLRDGRETGVVASRIERRNHRIRAFTQQGWVWMSSRATDGTMAVLGIGARLTPGTMRDDVVLVEVIVRREQHPGPLVALLFNSLEGGGVKDLSKMPVLCPPGQWLSATIAPADVDVEVVAHFGRQVIRAIPTVGLDTVEE